MISTKTVEVSVVGTSDDHGRKAGVTPAQEKRCVRSAFFGVLRALKDAYPFIAVALDIISGYKVEGVTMQEGAGYGPLGLTVQFQIAGQSPGKTIKLTACETWIKFYLQEDDKQYSEEMKIWFDLKPDEQGKPDSELQTSAEDSLESLLTRWGCKNGQ